MRSHTFLQIALSAEYLLSFLCRSKCQGGKGEIIFKRH